MPIPTVKIEIGFDTTSVGGPFFTFGSSSVKEDNPQSIFDNVDYRFGGQVLYDVTSRAKNFTINRGRSRILDKTQTGSANITFTNQDRAFDPFYESSPYYPDIRPRRDVVLTTIVGSSTAVQFTGLVEDWSLDYRVTGESIASAACVDGFALFGGQQLNLHTATSQTSGNRISAILNRSEVDWPAGLRDIDTGSQTLQADVIEQGRETLDYLQLVETSEQGFLFMSKTNEVTFRDANTAAAIGTVVFSDAGTAIPYQDITVDYGTELLYNRVTVARSGGTVQTAVDSASQSDYGIVSLDLNGLLSNSDASANAIANFLIGKYSQPELRFATMTVQLAGLGTADQTTVLGVELGDIVRVEYQPNQIGSRIVKDVQVIGLRHAASPDSYEVTFSFQSTETAVFIFGGGSAAASYPFSLFAGGTVTGSPFGL